MEDRKWKVEGGGAGLTPRPAVLFSTMELSAEELLEQWDVLHATPRFLEGGYKVEINERGQVILSPPSNRHTQLQAVIYDILKASRPDGLAFPEYTLQTSGGIKAPDVVWCSKEWFALHKDEHLAAAAPEICVEVMSRSNTLAEMEQKRDLYFERGCHEFILVDLKGFVTVFAPDGQLEQSIFFPDFPKQVHPPG